MNLPLRMLARDWRAGELRILAVALVLAVAAISSVGFFADRVRQSLFRDAHQLLGADVLIVGDQPWPAEIREEIVRRGMTRAETVTFVSMTRLGESTQLSGVKAVSGEYPLRGKLRVAPALNVPDAEARAPPERGTVWADERLAQALGVKVGDRLDLGESKLLVTAILTMEPDRAPSFFNIAPRMIMRLEDLSATGLIQEGSRSQHALLAAGDREQVSAFEAWVKPRLSRGQQLQSLDSARPEIRNSLVRAERFVGLTAMLAVILAAVAVSLATRRYSARHLDGYAVMRCLGATQGRLLALCAAEFLALGIAASLLGGVLGYIAQMLITDLVAVLVGARLPQPSLLPALQGLLTGLVLLLGFSLPPLLQLKNVPAIRVLRRDVGAPRQGAVVAWGLGVLALGGLLVWQAKDLQLGLIVAGGFAAAFVLFGALSYAALQLLGRTFGKRGAGITWRYGFASLRRHARSSTVQILGLALGLTAILLLTFTRDDLLDTWRASMPPDAPNRFIVNIQPEQRDAVAALFVEQGVPTPRIYPMVRGRVTAHNGTSIDADAYTQTSRRLVEREFNLSYTDRLPGENSVAQGRWFNSQDLESGALSVEASIARRLGWKLGDTLRWQVAEQTFTAPITSVRELSWDSMNVNFFVIATPKLLANAPQSYVTSFHLPDAKAAFGTVVAKRFSNLTVIDTSAILRQVRSVVDQVVKAVQFVFLFALGAGVLVLYAALLATKDERAQEAALMRALGASRSQIRSAQRAEFLAMGAIAGVLASAGAVAIGWAIAHYVLHFPYQVDPWIWLAGPVGGLACVALNAWAGARAALNHPPLLALREA